MSYEIFCNHELREIANPLIGICYFFVQLELNTYSSIGFVLSQGASGGLSHSYYMILQKV